MENTPPTVMSGASGACGPEHGMVVYYTEDGRINDNPETMGYKVFVGSRHKDAPFQMQTVFYRNKDQAAADSALVHAHETGVDRKKWLKFYLDAIVRKDRRIEKHKLHDLPDEMKEVLKNQQQVIVCDIDGTLKHFEGISMANAPMTDAVRYLNYMADAGKMIIYLTARGTTMAGITKDWLKKSGFPVGPLFVCKRDVGYIRFKHQQKYKELMLKYIQANCNIIELYGDQSSDMKAYHTISHPEREIYRVNSETFWTKRCNSLRPDDEFTLAASAFAGSGNKVPKMRREASIRAMQSHREAVSREAARREELARMEAIESGTSSLGAMDSCPLTPPTSTSAPKFVPLQGLPRN